MATVPTVDEFVSGLKQYWRSVGGGSQQQFLNLAAQPPREWDTTVLTQWLGILAQKFRDLGYPLAQATYDGGIAPLVNQVGVDRAIAALVRVADEADRSEIGTAERQRKIAMINTALSDLNQQRSSAQAGVAEVRAALSGPNIDALVDVLQRYAVPGMQRTEAFLNQEKLRLQNEIAGAA